MRTEADMMDAEMDAFDIYEAWQNADHYTNPVTGMETWAAATPTGTQYAFSVTSYNRYLIDAVDVYTERMAIRVSFENNVDICPW